MNAGQYKGRHFTTYVSDVENLKRDEKCATIHS